MSTYFLEPSVIEWISQAEAARLRGVSRQAIARLVARGRVRSEIIAGRRVVCRADVVAFEPRPAGRPTNRSPE